ncbi:MAG: N-acetyl-1-D-myo-inositol-2-amino-2-deoxy-alpha-D-glucopyranoside deacetylase [Actinobacteria bacterium]|nr:N-acetyl-1-D-myo-inositol-2-amino-2-deoxy-alpha-D-glucopyranoside deacetylase [Actinomycetota bacterium]MTB27267.1 N-acetyl-1-D-myo-inositol-2-amino-2-deoxy-alpha-D-glucopyranoside deacetylase [Actinomycetota bacterium]
MVPHWARYLLHVTRRLLLIHAHPDDESIATGITMAKYASLGAQVTLVTCTLGEEGEILLPDVAHLAADKDDKLGEHRQAELGEAMNILGISDWRLLGGAGRFRDSGMIGTPPNENPACFWRTDLLEASVELVKVIRETRPQVAITYDDFGSYGHPDHLQANRITHYAAVLAAVPGFKPELGAPWEIKKIYWTAMSRNVMRAGVMALRAAGETTGFAELDPDELPFATDDALITTEIDGPEFVQAKMDALRAHATQVNVDGGFFALSNNLGAQIFATEHYRLAVGQLGELVDGRERDLFSGIDA